MIHEERNWKKFPIDTKVTITLLGNSLKSFKTASHFSHSSFPVNLAIILYFAFSFHFTFKLTVKYLLGPSNQTPSLQYFSCSELTYLFMARVIFPDYHIYAISSLSEIFNGWLADFLNQSELLSPSFKTTTIWLLLPCPDLSLATPEFPYSFSKDALCFPTWSSWLIIFPLPGMPSHLVSVFQLIFLHF